MGHVEGLEPEWGMYGGWAPQSSHRPPWEGVRTVTMLGDREGLRQQPLERRTHQTMSPERYMDDRWALSPPDAQLALLVRILLVTRKPAATVDKGTV